MTLQELIREAIQEDLPTGDLTTDSLSARQKRGRARLVAKEDLVLSGQEAFSEAIRQLEPEAQIKWHFNDGDFLLAQQTACTLTGNLLQILKAERVALNFLGRLSGVATLTRCFVKEVEHTQCRILDTRKTTPLFRTLEKQAVLHGKGHNHRKNLSDAVMIKENHIRVAGSIQEAVNQVRQNTDAPIEVECASLEEVRQAAELRVDQILLDNMSNETMAEALRLIPSIIKTEASGNMTLERVRGVAELGVDFISIGALTHSAPCADLSLLFEWDQRP